MTRLAWMLIGGFCSFWAFIALSVRIHPPKWTFGHTLGVLFSIGAIACFLTAYLWRPHQSGKSRRLGDEDVIESDHGSNETNK